MLISSLSVNVQLGEKIQSISNRVDIEFNNCYTDVIKDERIKRKAEVCQVSPRPHSGPMIHQNNSQNSGKLLFLWLCFIILFTYCWIVFAETLLRIFTSMFMSYICLQFSCNVFLVFD